ncbi:MAG: hypothetical protein M1836_004722 [Candelina mexicana]|nr:MAG: hypothetical protein M1836_004722 [Candelina mexicana]
MSPDEETKLLHARAKTAMKWQVHSNLKSLRRRTESQQASPLEREPQTKRTELLYAKAIRADKYRIRLSIRVLKRGKEYQQASKLELIRMEIRERGTTIRKRTLEGKHASVKFGTVESAERQRSLAARDVSFLAYWNNKDGTRRAGAPRDAPEQINIPTEQETPGSINHGHATKRIVIPAAKKQTQTDNASDKVHK